MRSRNSKKDVGIIFIPWYSKKALEVAGIGLEHLTHTMFNLRDSRYELPDGVYEEKEKEYLTKFDAISKHDMEDIVTATSYFANKLTTGNSNDVYSRNLDKSLAHPIIEQFLTHDYEKSVQNLLNTLMDDKKSAEFYELSLHNDMVFVTINQGFSNLILHNDSEAAKVFNCSLLNFMFNHFSEEEVFSLDYFKYFIILN